MGLRCVQCHASLLGSEALCPACGRPVDADGNGLPDDLDARVQSAARAAVAEAKRDELAQASNAARQKELNVAELALRTNVETPRSWWGLAAQRGRNGFLATTMILLAGFVMPVRMALDVFGISVAGAIVCPLQCADCAGPGRNFMWNYRGSCQANKGRMGSALVCHNPVLDVDSARWSDITRNNDALQPYIVHGFVAYFVECIGLGALVGLLRFLFGTRRALRRLDDERATLEAAVQRLRARPPR